MRGMRALFLLGCAFAGSLAFAAGPEDVLLKADHDFCQAVTVRRLDGWMEFMAENAVVGLASPGPITGKTAIRAVMEKQLTNPDFSLVWAPTRAEVFRGGTMGYTVGRWTRTMKDGKGTQIAHGSYLTVWQKQADGSWKVVGDGGEDDPE